MINFTRTEHHPHITLEDATGLIPLFHKDYDKRPLKEQFQERYIGGWHPLSKFQYNENTNTLVYPGDPPMWPLATAQVKDEEIIVYPGAWVMVRQADGTFEVSRMD